MVDQFSPSFQDTQLVHDGCEARLFGCFQALLKYAGTIDNASQTPAQHIQQSTDTGQKDTGAIESWIRCAMSSIWFMASHEDWPAFLGTGMPGLGLSCKPRQFSNSKNAENRSHTDKKDNQQTGSRDEHGFFMSLILAVTT